MIKLKQKTEKKNRINKLMVLQLILTFSLAVFGLYYEWASGVAAVLLTAFLMLCYKQNGKLYLPKGWTFAASLTVVALFGLSALWAVDKGMALFGMVKFLPVPLFIIALCQMADDDKEKLLNSVPVIAGAIALVSFLGFIPALHDVFFVGDRFYGTWQYPNSFALLLLVGIIITLSGEKLQLRQFLIIAVSVFGIAITGSRTTFILLVLTVIWFLFTLKNKRAKLVIAGMLAALIAGTGIYVTVTGNISSIGRYLTTSLSTSTFVGRFLYFKDALPVIASHPLGLGYLGYHFTQGSFQTGVYYVVNVHNELLQMLLDIGWIPAAVCIVALLKSFKKVDRKRRLIIIAIILHSMLDFDLQFVAMAFILVLAMQEENAEKKAIKCKGGVLSAAAILICLVSAYFSTASGLYYSGNCEAAAKLYPGYTLAEIQLLQAADNPSDMRSIANDIVRKNKSVSIAYSAKARAAYAEGDFGKMIEYKERAIELNKYALDDYLDYFDMLYVGYQMYMQYGDTESAGYCRERLEAIPDMISEVLDNTSPAAWKITDKPELALPDEATEILESLN